MPLEGSSSSKRTHLNKVWEQTGKKPDELEKAPKPPKELLYIWDWFIQLIQFGEINWQTLHAWVAMRGFKPNAFETELLLTLNRLYINRNHGNRRNTTTDKGK